MVYTGYNGLVWLDCIEVNFELSFFCVVSYSHLAIYSMLHHILHVEERRKAQSILLRTCTCFLSISSGVVQHYTAGSVLLNWAFTYTRQVCRLLGMCTWFNTITVDQWEEAGSTILGNEYAESEITYSHWSITIQITRRMQSIVGRA